MATASTRAAAPGHNRAPLVTAADLARDFAHVQKAIAELEAEAAKAPTVVEDDEDIGIISGLVSKLRAAAKRCDELRDETKRPYLAAGNVVQEFFKALEKRMTDAKASLELRGTRYLNKKASAEKARRDEEARKAAAEAQRQQAVAAETARQANQEHAFSRSVARAAEAQEFANAAAAAADEARRSAEAKPADLARTHTEGGTGTLRQRWRFEIIEPHDIPLEPLRSFIPFTEIEKAIQRFIDTNKNTKQLPGIRIYCDTQAQFK